MNIAKIKKRLLAKAERWRRSLAVKICGADGFPLSSATGRLMGVSGDVITGGALCYRVSLDVGRREQLKRTFMADVAVKMDLLRLLGHSVTVVIHPSGELVCVMREAHIAECLGIPDGEE